MGWALGVLLAVSSAWGVSSRKVDESYSSILGLDKYATVALTRGDVSCTGTAVSDTRIITAEHCVDAMSETGDVNIDGIESLAVYSLKKYQGVETSQWDIAVLRFPPGTGAFLGIRKYPELATKSPGPGDTVYLVGFGMNDVRAAFLGTGPAGRGLKGWGVATLGLAEEGVLATRTLLVSALEIEAAAPLPPDNEDTHALLEKLKLPIAPPESRLLKGDSGGAAYNLVGKIVGVASQLLRFPNETTISVGDSVETKLWSWDVSNVFVDTTSPSSAAVFSLADAGEKDAPKVDLRAFAKSVVRTGRYFNTDKPAEVVYLRTNYIRGEVASVDFADLGNAEIEVIPLRCVPTKKTCYSFGGSDALEYWPGGIRYTYGDKNIRKTYRFELNRS